MHGTRLCTCLITLCCQPLLLSAPGSAGDGVLEEVVVIAQRIEQSAQDTPISLATLDADDMALRGIGNVAEIEAQVPNFVIDAFPSSNQTLRLFIRGVGITDVQITQDPAVGVYLDGVYLARSTGLASDVAELARIEILRGPQGTLYGRNTTGGALNLVTERPQTDTVSFSQELGSGSRDRLMARTAINLPMGDDHALRLAALGRREDGFVRNSGPGGGFGDRRAEGYRLDWRWLAGDLITVDYSWDKSRVESHNYTPQAVLPGVPAGTPADAAIISSRRFVPYASDRLERLSTSVPLQPTDTDIQGHSLQIQWDLDAVALKSITAWRELSDASYIDFASGASAEYRVDFSAITLGRNSAAPLVYDSVRTRLQQEQLSQEFQLFLQREAFSLTAGLYYFEEDAKESWFPLHHIFSFPVVETGDAGKAVNIRAEENRIDNQALAAYGQFTWQAIEDWRFTFGLRYSRDRRAVQRRFRQDNYVDFGNLVLGPFETIDFQARARDDFDDTSFSLIAERDLSADTLVYAKLGEAYKSGGFNTRDPDPDFFSRGFDEEKNRTAELGLKAELLQRALRLNAAVFHADFEDMQLNFLLPNSLSDTRVFNSGNATISGLELELTGFLGKGLLARFSYAYLDSEIDEVRDPFTGELRSFGFDNAPRNSASLNLDYRLDPRSYGTWYFNINASYVDERRQHDELLFIDDYSLLNGRVGLAEIPLRWGELSLSAWVKNALDEEFVNFTIDNLPHASRAVLWGEPRRWGLDLRYRY